MSAFHLSMGYLHLEIWRWLKCGDLVRLCHYLQSRHADCVEVFGNLVPNITPKNQIWPIQDWIFSRALLMQMVIFCATPYWREGDIFPANVAESAKDVWRFFINVAARKGPWCVYACNNNNIFYFVRRMKHSTPRDWKGGIDSNSFILR